MCLCLEQTGDKRSDRTLTLLTKKCNQIDVRKGEPLNVQIFIRRIPFSEVPTDEVESAKFLHKLYKEKVNID